MDASIIEEWDNEFSDISKQFAFDKIKENIKSLKDENRLECFGANKNGY